MTKPILDDETRLLLEQMVREHSAIPRPPDEQVLARAVLAIVERLESEKREDHERPTKSEAP